MKHETKPLEVNYMAIPGLKYFESRIMNPPSAIEIIYSVSKFYNIPETKMYTKTRKQPYMEAKQLAQYLMRVLTQMNYEEIGRIFNCDHATIINSVKKIDGYKLLYPEMTEKIMKIKALIDGNRSKIGIGDFDKLPNFEKYKQLK